jgi:hypothetical protein
METDPAPPKPLVVILVHWLIRKGQEKAFKARWKEMTIKAEAGLYREILTELSPSEADPKFHTFSLGDPFYTTFINIGMWESVHAFDAAVGKYIPQAATTEKDGRVKYTIELDAFEFKMRERVVLRVVNDRGGDLPPATMSE